MVHNKKKYNKYEIFEKKNKKKMLFIFINNLKYYMLKYGSKKKKNKYKKNIYLQLILYKNLIK